MNPFRHPRREDMEHHHIFGSTQGTIDLTGSDDEKPVQNSAARSKRKRTVSYDEEDPRQQREDSELDDLNSKEMELLEEGIDQEDEADFDTDDVIYVKTSTRQVSPDRQVNYHTFNHLPIWIGSGWELENGEFFRVRRIIRSRTSTDVELDGYIFTRSWKVDGFMGKNKNELVALVTAPQDVINPQLDDYLVTIKVSELACPRDIILSNVDFQPQRMDAARRLDHSYRDDPRTMRLSKLEIDETCVLVCRPKFGTHGSLRDGGRVPDGAIHFLRESEADPGKSCSDVLKRYHYREEKTNPTPTQMSKKKKKKRRTYPNLVQQPVQTQAGEGGRPHSETIIIDSDEEAPTATGRTSEIPVRQHSTPSRLEMRASEKSDLSYEIHTFADVCAGFGGASSGAALVGFLLVYMLDLWEVACETLKLNWPQSRIFRKDIHDFCLLESAKWMVVALLHISYPCQAFSQANRGGGKNDDKNRFTGLSVIQLLKKIKPLVVTFEQTDGILHKAHYEYFQAMIHQLISMKYSVRWRILDCACSGNCQHRKRLFVIASCPGQPLPPFPEPTHGPGLLPIPTIDDRLKVVPPVWDIEPHMLQCSVGTKHCTGIPYDPRRQLKHTITCSGGESDLHPSGTRTFNMKELALLQDFGVEHKFAQASMTDLRKGIGNAIPVCQYEAIAKSCQKTMEDYERAVAAYIAENKRNAISIDDD